MYEYLYTKKIESNTKNKIGCIRILVHPIYETLRLDLILRFYKRCSLKNASNLSKGITPA